MEEYHKMIDARIITPAEKVELIHGEIIEISPITPRHAGVVNLLNSIFSYHGFGKIVVGPQNPIELNPYSEPEPDIVIAKYRPDHYTISHPKPEDIQMVIEVSISTYPYDLETKLPLYAEAGIPELWIVNIEEEQIEVNKTPVGNIYKYKEIYQGNEEISTDTIDFKMKVNEIIL
ncbi:MAG: Uma2 family endonuclease [Bacteroidota bacterium]